MTNSKELNNNISNQISGGSITPKIPVPNVIEIDEEDAKARLNNAGINYEIVYVENYRPKGTVFISDPVAGTYVITPCTVKLFVSKGLR